MKKSGFKAGLILIFRLFNHILSFSKALIHRPLIRSQKYSRSLGAPGKILILAPHMDDEIIGCAGIIKLYSRRGCQITCIYLTDSAYGLKGDEGRALHSIRVRETQKAASLLGIRKMLFLDQPDGALNSSEKIVARLAGFINKEKPEHIYLPYPYDTHPDHRNAWRLFSDVRKKLDARNFKLYFYQIQVPLPLEEIHTVIDISEVFKEKQKAFKIYRSQNQVPFDVILHLQCCQKYLLGVRPRAVELFAVPVPGKSGARFETASHRVRPISRYSEVGFYAIRRKAWI